VVLHLASETTKTKFHEVSQGGWVLGVETPRKYYYWGHDIAFLLPESSELLRQVGIPIDHLCIWVSLTLYRFDANQEEILRCKSSSLFVLRAAVVYVDFLFSSRC